MPYVRRSVFEVVCAGLAVLSAACPTLACTIFATEGAGHVLVGNNEDDTPGQRSYLWFRSQGSIGYVLWGHDRQRPEGGMNEKGLFFDAAALPEPIPLRRVAGRRDLERYAVEPILRRFATVEQSIAYLSRFNLVWQEKAQIFLADANGNTAIIHPNYIIRSRADKNPVLSNHRMDLDAPAVCWRRELAQHLLSSRTPHDMESIGRILQETAQNDLGNSTLYSLAIDLAAGTISLNYDRRFGSPVEISLASELRKGAHVVEMSMLLPPSLADEVSTRGLEAVRERLTSMTPAREMSRTGYELLRRGKSQDAIEVFRIASQRLGTAAAYSDLANALNFVDRPQEAQTFYEQALALDGSDYSANLMGRSDGVVTFRLKAFAFAANVSVPASFNGNDAKAFALENIGGEWRGSVKLPAGKYFYSFHVDDSWSTDPLNGLSGKPSEYFASVLIVR